MTKDLFLKYANLKQEISNLKHQLDEIRPLIMAEMPEGKDVELEGVGTFTVTKSRNWLYPQEVEELRDEIKEMEKKSQQMGTAKYTESVSLRFTGK